MTTSQATPPTSHNRTVSFCDLGDGVCALNRFDFVATVLVHASYKTSGKAFDVGKTVAQIANGGVGGW